MPRCGWPCCCCPLEGWKLATARLISSISWGSQAEARKDYDQALEYYQEALKLDPKDASYELAARRTRFESSTAHVEAGNNQRKAGDLEKALAEFQKAFDVNPGSMIALQDMQQIKELLTEKQKLSTWAATSDVGGEGGEGEPGDDPVPSARA